MKAKYYIIDGLNERFETLRAAKMHFDFYTESEKVAEIGNYILGISVSDETVSITPIKGIRKGRMIFGKTEKA